MKQKGGIALMGMIIVILLCNVVFAEHMPSISEEEIMIWQVSYEGGECYSWTILTYSIFDSEHQFIILSIPESSIGISIYERKNNEELEEEYYEIIDNETKLEEVCEKRNISMKSRDTLENALPEVKEIGWNLLIIFYPSYLYEEGEFLLDIHFKNTLGKYWRDKYYRNLYIMSFYGDIDVISRFDFILPPNAKPWFQNIRGDSDITENNRIVLSWKVAEKNIECIQLGFGTPEERLYWENKINDIRSFIYVIIGLFLAITIPIIFTKVKSEKCKRIKHWILFLVLPIFVMLFYWRIINFKLEEIPLEICFQGKCLKVEIICALIILLVIYSILLIFSRHCIDKNNDPSRTTNESRKKNINFHIDFGENIGKNLSDLFLVFFSASSAIIFSRYFATYKGSIFLYGQTIISGLNKGKFWYTAFACFISILTLILSFLVAFWFMNWLKNKVEDTSFWLLFSKYIPLIFIVSLAPLCSFWIGTSILSGLDADYLSLINTIDHAFKWFNSTYIFAYIELVLLLAILYNKVSEEKSLYTIFTLPITFVFFYISSKLLASSKYFYLGLFNFIILISLCLILGYIYLKHNNRANV